MKYSVAGYGDRGQHLHAVQAVTFMTLIGVFAPLFRLSKSLRNAGHGGTFSSVLSLHFQGSRLTAPLQMLSFIGLPRSLLTIQPLGAFCLLGKMPLFL